MIYGIMFKKAGGYMFKVSEFNAGAKKVKSRLNGDYRRGDEAAVSLL